MYQALYRKYRPRDFDSVVGQDSLVKTLKNAIKNGSFCHAYMFFGPRGTGKTTLSKIFARSINCTDSIDGNACGKCTNCIYASDKECVDIIEIDAASNNGVDEIRELKNKISLVPSQLKFKVYIIDEVHMLSLGAFNALLKTLEEPPEHAVFILATTDLQKVPETIISRCQCFSFKRISENSIVERLKYICDLEKIDIDDDVLMEIALASEGGMRDALGILDKLRSFCDGRIIIDDFVELNGLITRAELEILIDAIMNGNSSETLKILSSYNDSGKNIIQIISQIMCYLRDILVSHFVNDEKIYYNIDAVIELINTINEKMFDIKKSGNPNIFVEMLLLKFMSIYTVNDKIISREIISNESINTDLKIKVDFNKENLADNIELNQESLDTDVVDEHSDFINSAASEETLKNTSNDENITESDSFDALKLENLLDIMKARVNNTLALADKKILKQVVNDMNIFNEYAFDDKIGYIACSLLDAKIRAASENNIIISYDYDSIVKQNLLILDKLTSVFNQLTNSNKKLAIITDEQWEVEKNKYINFLKEGKTYTVVEEPEVKVFEDYKKNDIIVNSAVELFGDIVEIE